MAATHPTAPLDWSDLAREWHEAWQRFGRWWSHAGESAPAAPSPTVSPAAPAAAPFDPAVTAALNARFLPRFEALWAAAQAAVRANDPAALLPDIAAPAPNDRRFASPGWHAQPYFAFLKQAYLLYAEYLSALAASATLDGAQRRRLQFVTRHYLDAIAPTNYAATNPDVLARAAQTHGASFVQGFCNLQDDIRKGRITMSDESAFAVGRNLATTPGSVVYRNELIELIQYDAATPTVHRRPLVMVPPCINKYYILDLTQANSLVRHAVAQGHTTFMISWRNVPAALGGLTWNDYLENGPLAAFRVARAITGSRTVDALGFCVGGTLLASALAVLAARNDRGVASATFLTTMLDFADPGDVGVYVSAEALAARAPALLGGARLPGSELANAFASLRANELVWNYVVNNYLKGRSPPAFDLLYWNADSANLAGPMYAYYMENMYVGNRLREPGALTMLGERVDLGRIAMPCYVYASRDDHIVPWRSAYATTRLVGGDVTFVLGASGHIAGVVNPPMPRKRNYWTSPWTGDDPDTWLAGAVEVPGSWWTHWDPWIAARAGRRRRAPAHAGNAAHPPLMAAPGGYVLERTA